MMPISLTELEEQTALGLLETDTVSVAFLTMRGQTALLGIGTLRSDLGKAVGIVMLHSLYEGLVLMDAGVLSHVNLLGHDVNWVSSEWWSLEETSSSLL